MPRVRAPAARRAVAAGDGHARRRGPLRRVRASLPGPPGPGRHLRRPREPRRDARLHGVRRRRRRRRWTRSRRSRSSTSRPGTRAYSLATAGCPFHCVFCQNWEIAQGPRLGVRPPARRLSPERVVDEALDGRCAVDRLHLRRADGLPRVRARHRPPGARRRPAQPVHHRRLRDAGGDRPPRHGPRRRQRGPEVRSTTRSTGGSAARDSSTSSRPSRAYRRAGVWLEVTTLVIPGENDDPSELRDLTAWIVDHLGPETPWHVSRFFPAFRMRTTRRRRSPRSAGPRRSVARPASATSTSATRRSWRWRTPAAPGATPCSWRGAATASSATCSTTGPARGCGRRARRAGARSVARRGPGPMRMTHRPDVAAAPTRRPAVAGSFYPADPSELARLVDDLLATAVPPDGGRGGATAASPPASSSRTPGSSTAARSRPSAWRLAGTSWPPAAGAALRRPEPSRPRSSCSARTTVRRGSTASGSGIVGPGATPLGDVAVDEAPRRGHPRRSGRRSWSTAMPTGPSTRSRSSSRSSAPSCPARGSCPLAVGTGRGDLAVVRRRPPGEAARGATAERGPDPPRDQHRHGALPAGRRRRRASRTNSPRSSSGSSRRAWRDGRRTSSAPACPGVVCGMCGIEPTVLGLAALRAMGVEHGAPRRSGDVRRCGWAGRSHRRLPGGGVHRLTRPRSRRRWAGAGIDRRRWSPPVNRSVDAPVNLVDRGFQPAG